MASALTFLERYHRDGNGALSNIVRVTSDETSVSFVNVKTKEQSKQRMNTPSPNKLEKFKKSCLPARNLLATVFWERKGVLMVK
jgi:hypothetical protein